MKIKQIPLGNIWNWSQIEILICVLIDQGLFTSNHSSFNHLPYTFFSIYWNSINEKFQHISKRVEHTYIEYYQ